MKNVKRKKLALAEQKGKYESLGDLKTVREWPDDLEFLELRQNCLGYVSPAINSIH